MNIKSSKNKFWISEIDGLRGLAIILVMLTHYSINNLPPKFLYWLHPDKNGYALANMAVVCFFIISSFLLTYIFVNEITFTKKINFKNFLLRRIARIWPLYFFMVAISYYFIMPQGPFALDWYEEPDKWQYLNKNIWAVMTFVFNWILTFREFPNIFPAEFSVLWSVAIEEQIYVLLPFLMLVLYSVPRKISIMILLLLIVLAIICRYFFFKYYIVETDFNRGMYYCTLTYIDVFVIGGVSGYIYATNMKVLNFIKKVPLLLVLLALGWNVKNLGTCLWPPYNFMSVYIYLFTAISFSIFLLKIVNNDNLYLTSFLNNKLLKKIGILSYGLYIWHMLAMDLTNYLLIKYDILSILNSNQLYVVCNFIVFITLTFTIAVLTYWILERPIIKIVKAFIVKSKNYEKSHTVNSNVKPDLI